MSRISVEKFISGLYSIYSQKPIYKIGYDGSDGSCDGIGFIRGSLLRGGATRIANMKEINQFARKVALNLRKIDSFVKSGDILLKVKDADDNSMPLPSKYRFGGSEYNGDVNNYVDVCVAVSSTKFLHMTNDGIVEENNAKNWDYMCELPYIEEEGEKAMSSAMVFTENGDSVKLYANPSFSCEDIVSIPNKTLVMVENKNERWTKVLFGEKSGYVLSRFIKPVENKEINGVDMKEIEKAYLILGKVLGYVK